MEKVKQIMRFMVNHSLNVVQKPQVEGIQATKEKNEKGRRPNKIKILRKCVYRCQQTASTYK